MKKALCLLLLSALLCAQSQTENSNLYADFLSPVLQISPFAPFQCLVTKDAQPDARLFWESRAGSGSYSIYRATTIEFTPVPGNFVATVTDTSYTDAGVLAGPATQQYYIVLVNNT